MLSFRRAMKCCTTCHKETRQATRPRLPHRGHVPLNGLLSKYRPSSPKKKTCSLISKKLWRKTKLLKTGIQEETNPREKKENVSLGGFLACLIRALENWAPKVCALLRGGGGGDRGVDLVVDNERVDWPWSGSGCGRGGGGGACLVILERQPWVATMKTNGCDIIASSGEKP